MLEDGCLHCLVTMAQLSEILKKHNLILQTEPSVFYYLIVCSAQFYIFYTLHTCPLPEIYRLGDN